MFRDVGYTIDDSVVKSIDVRCTVDDSVYMKKSKIQLYLYPLEGSRCKTLNQSNPKILLLPTTNQSHHLSQIL